MKYGEYRQQCRNIIGRLNRKSDFLYKVYRYYDDNPWSKTHFRNNQIVFKVDREVLAMYKTWKEMFDFLKEYEHEQAN